MSAVAFVLCRSSYLRPRSTRIHLQPPFTRWHTGQSMPTLPKGVFTIDPETLEQERVRILRERIEINERLIHKTGKKRREAKAELRDLNAQYEAVCREIKKAKKI